MSVTNPAPVCAICKQPLVRTSEQFFVCSNPDFSHRGLIPAGRVEMQVSEEATQRRRNLDAAKERSEAPIEV